MLKYVNCHIIDRHLAVAHYMLILFIVGGSDKRNKPIHPSGCVGYEKNPYFSTPIFRQSFQ
jgi:hypothetical protein